jgi:hypothetical protein
MKEPSDTLRVFIPLAYRRQNGRPRILSPSQEDQSKSRTQDPHVLRALGRAWAWRRRLEAGEAATIQEIAKAEKVSDRFVSRVMRLAYLSPNVIERLLIWREPPSVTINELIEATTLPWSEQMERVFEKRRFSGDDHGTGRSSTGTSS